MPFTITAEFPLGFYQGRNQAGQVESAPTPVRLLSALVATAGSSSLAEVIDGELRISDASRTALRWLEAHPPDEIALPEHIINDPGVTAFKHLGLRIRDRFDLPTAKDAIARSSLNGPIHWRWTNGPPPSVVGTLQQLLSEVPYLGEAASPVTMHASTDDFELSEPIVLVDSQAAGPTAQTLQVPDEGRLAALEAQHIQSIASGASNPSVKNEAEFTARWPDQGIRQLWYEPSLSERIDSNPWSEAFIIELGSTSAGASGWPPLPRDHVRWSVALHRTLIRAVGQDVPPVLTGRYEPGTDRPANNVSIQVLRLEDNLRHEWTAGAIGGFAVLIPADTTEIDRTAIYKALAGSRDRTIRPGRSQGAVVMNIHQQSATEFWQPPADGHKRFWVTRPLAIAETRPLRSNAHGNPWTISDAIKLSVGMAWRDQFRLDDTGEELYRSLALAVGEQIKVIGGQRVHDRDLPRFVHRAHPSNVITGYRSMLELSALLDDTAPAAIGQSRHLGGGLLVPLDVPNALLNEDGTPLWH